MTPNLLKIIWVLLPACAVLSALIGWIETEPPTSGLIFALTAIILIGWSALTLRLLTFRKKLYHFLRRLLAGDYEAGIRSRKLINDEISRLEEMANQVAERLREYDRLRADRVSVQARALDLTVRNSGEMLITADTEKETLIFNPAAQKRLGISGKSWPFEAILKPNDNATFARLFNRAVSGSKLNTEGNCRLKLPGMDNPVMLHILILPLRDRNEAVRFILITIDDVKDS